VSGEDEFAIAKRLEERRCAASVQSSHATPCVNLGSNDPIESPCVAVVTQEIDDVCVRDGQGGAGAPTTAIVTG
jgi:hypothetical protein